MSVSKPRATCHLCRDAGVTGAQFPYFAHVPWMPEDVKITWVLWTDASCLFFTISFPLSDSCMLSLWPLPLLFLVCYPLYRESRGSREIGPWMPRNLSNGFIKLAVLLKLSDLLTARTSVALSAFFLQGSEIRGQSNSLLRGKLWPGKVLENFHDTLKFQGGKKKDVMWWIRTAGMALCFQKFSVWES